MFLRAILIASAAALLPGCAVDSAQVRVSSDYTAQVERIGVVSLLPARPKVSYLSTSALESHFGKLDLPGWDSDRLVYRTLLARLGHEGHDAAVLRRSAALEAARASDWRPPAGGNVAEAVYAAGAAAGLDMVVVVQAQVDEDFVTETNQKVRAYGIQRAFDTGPRVYATVVVEVYDIERRFVVGRAAGRQSEAAVEGAWRPAFDAVDGTTTLAGDAGTALAEQLERVLGTTLGVATQEVGL